MQLQHSHAQKKFQPLCL